MQSFSYCRNQVIFCIFLTNNADKVIISSLNFNKNYLKMVFFTDIINV